MSFYHFLRNRWKQDVLYFIIISLIFSTNFIYQNFGKITDSHVFSKQSFYLILSFIQCAIVIPLILLVLIMSLQKWFSDKKRLKPMLWTRVERTFPILLIVIGIVLAAKTTGPFNYFELCIFTLVIIIHLSLLVDRWKQGLLYFFVISLIFIPNFIYRNFGNITADQFFSNLLLGTDGLFTVPSDLIFSFTRSVIVISLMATLLILNLQQWINKKSSLKSRLWVSLKRTLPILLLYIGIFQIEKVTNIFTRFISYYLPQNNGGDLFAKNYVNPQNLQFTATHPKSLIYIYMESIESTYSNKKLFGRNLLEPLTDLKQQAISFNQYIQTSGTGWTMVAILATQCGIPYKLTTRSIANFLPRAVCLSDILNKLGYQNVFLKGGSLSFADLGSFLRNHHYYEVFGLDEWLHHGFHHSDIIGWGLPDDLLFQQAKIKLEQLVKNKKLFNLTILTVDTHGVDGQLNKTCRARGAKDFVDIVECSAYEVADFINYIEQKGWLDKLTVIIVGDHLALSNQFIEKLRQNPSRYIFNRIISNDKLRKNREVVYHVDFFPTVLQALGIHWSGNQLALGYSAIAPVKPPYSAKKRFDTIEQIVISKSPFYNTLWLDQ